KPLAPTRPNARLLFASAPSPKPRSNTPGGGCPTRLAKLAGGVVPAALPQPKAKPNTKNASAASGTMMSVRANASAAFLAPHMPPNTSASPAGISNAIVAAVSNGDMLCSTPAPRSTPAEFAPAALAGASVNGLVCALANDGENNAALNANTHPTTISRPLTIG